MWMDMKIEMKIQMEKEMNIEMEIDLFVDASAAIGIVQRQGLGKLRHIEVKNLWLQDEVKGERIRIRKVNGKENPADLGTKALGRDDMDKCVKMASS